MEKNIYGKLGEKKAEKYLKDKKYKILKMNYKNVLGEIDIIAFFEGYTIFVEVKSRSSKLFGQACEAVNFFKKRKIKQVALLYMKKNKLLDFNVRFDVIEVYEDAINHIENAF